MPRNGGNPAGTSSRNTSPKSCKTVETPREIGVMSLETKTSPLYMSTSGMVVGSSRNSLISSLVANVTRLGTLSLFVISLFWDLLHHVQLQHYLAYLSVLPS